MGMRPVPVPKSRTVPTAWELVEEVADELAVHFGVVDGIVGASLFGCVHQFEFRAHVGAWLGQSENRGGWKYEIRIWKYETNTKDERFKT